MSGTLVIFGLGSNVGDREQHIARAARALTEHPSIRLGGLRVSSLYESAAVLKDGAPPEWNQPFLNRVCCGETRCLPLALLAALKSIETALGRQARGDWAPREIDMDILAYGDEVIVQEQLIIPHPLMLERSFVLVPLAELLPEWTYPGEGVHKGKTMREILNALV